MFLPLVLAISQASVASSELTLPDPLSPDGKLPIRVSRPTGDGPFPVVVWSHIEGASREDYGPLVSAWTARGYAVVQPTHADSLVFGTPDEKFALRRGEARTRANWADRARQISLVIDQLGTIDQRLDAKRIAVGGHGFGAETAQLAAGTRPASGEPLTDARPLAFFFLSPSGPGGRFAADAFGGIRRPALVVSGEQDAARRERRPAGWRRQVYETMPPGGKHLAWLRTAGTGFGGVAGFRLPGVDEPDASQVATVAAVTTAFLDAYVRGSDAAKAALRANQIRLAAPTDLEHK